MPKRTIFTNITVLPPQVSRDVAIATLHDHNEMIELNPLIVEHHPISTPIDAAIDEFMGCEWQELTDEISFLPGGRAKGKVKYKACFHDLPNGLQTHIYAPMGLDIREKWTIAGALPGEPDEPQELGLNIPRRGLYIREEGDIRCNPLLVGFVRKNLNNSHKILMERILRKAQRSHTQNNSISSISSTSSVTNKSLATPSDRYEKLKAMNSRNSDLVVPTRKSFLEPPIHHGPNLSLPSHALQAKSLPPSPRILPTQEDAFPTLQEIHPAFRSEQDLIESSSPIVDSPLPLYESLDRKQTQLYKNDIAKNPMSRHVHAERESSDIPTLTSASSRYSREDDCLEPQTPIEPHISRHFNSVEDRILIPNRTGNFNETEENQLMSARSDLSYDIGATNQFNSISPFSSPPVEQRRFEPRFSMVSEISDLSSTPEMSQQTFGEDVERGR